MRLLVVWILGFALGISSGAAVLYFNPLAARARAVVALDEPQRLHYSVAGPAALALTHGMPLEQGIHPASMPTLFEAALAKAALGVFVIEDDSGVPVALASRLVKLSSKTNLVTRGLVLDENWLVTFPGSGSYFIESNSNLWSVLRDTVIDVGLFQQAWSDRRDYRVTVGPSLTGSATVTGATGVYRDAVGNAVDTIEVDGFERLDRWAEPIGGALDVSLSYPQPEGRTELGDSGEAPINVAREAP